MYLVRRVFGYTRASTLSWLRLLAYRCFMNHCRAGLPAYCLSESTCTTRRCRPALSHPSTRMLDRWRILFRRLSSFIVGLQEVAVYSNLTTQQHLNARSTNISVRPAAQQHVLACDRLPEQQVRDTTAANQVWRTRLLACRTCCMELTAT